MAVTVNWISGVIYVPKADMTLVQSNPFEIRELDMDAFRLTLRDLEEDPDGRPWPRTHDHNTEVTFGGATYARQFIILDPYTVTFEDGQYQVNLSGANSNLADRVNLNQVSIRSNNSAGLQTVGSGLTDEQNNRLLAVEKLLRNKTITDPTTGRQTVYEDDDTTPAFEADLFEDKDGTQPYRGQGADRRERLE